MTVPHKMVGLERMSDYRSIRLQRLLDYKVTLSVVYYCDCTSQDGWIRENVGLQRCWNRKVSL